MTLYITPVRRANRRRWVDRWQQDEDMPDMMQGQIFFPVDVVAEPDGFEISALLPGINPDDLNIQIVNETVSIQGEFKREEGDNKSYLLQERPYGRFSRVLTLPAPLDASGAEASYENGVLTLRIPKAETARPKLIKVQTKQ